MFLQKITQCLHREHPLLGVYTVFTRRTPSPTAAWSSSRCVCAYAALSVSNLTSSLKVRKPLLSPFAIHLNIPGLQINVSPFNFSFEMVKTWCLILSFPMSEMNSFNMCSFLCKSHAFIFSWKLPLVNDLWANPNWIVYKMANLCS